MTNICEVELKEKPSGIHDNEVFRLNQWKISAYSAEADDNGSYISKGNPRNHWDLEKAPCLAQLKKDGNGWTAKERDTDSCMYFTPYFVI